MPANDFMEVKTVHPRQGKSIELIDDGNVAGDDGNWLIIIVGARLKVQKRVSGSWVDTGGYSV